MYNQNVCVGIMETWSSTYACEFTVFKFLWTNIFARDIREIDTKEIDLSKVKMHWVNGKFAGTDKMLDLYEISRQASSRQRGSTLQLN